MKTFARTSIAAAALLAASFGLPGMAQAGGIKVGTLVCDVSGGIGLILGSNKSVRCNFARAAGGNEYYSGSITKLGIDIGVTKQATMAWVVFAPGDTHYGALAGSYVGATAEATLIASNGRRITIQGQFDKHSQAC